MDNDRKDARKFSVYRIKSLLFLAAYGAFLATVCMWLFLRRIKDKDVEWVSRAVNAYFIVFLKALPKVKYLGSNL